MKFINWLYFAQSTFNQKKVIYFLYGLSAPTNFEEKIQKKYTRNLSGKKDKLICLEFTSINHLYIKDKINFSEIFDIDEYATLSELISDIEVIDKRKSVQVSNEVYRDVAPSFLSLPLYMTSYFTDSFNRYYEKIILNKDKNSFLIDVIEILEKESKQPFKSTYSSRIGCYEIVQIDEWVEKLSTPCYLETRLNKEKTSRPYILKKHEYFLNKLFTLHLIVYNDYNEVIYDGINIIKRKQEELFICEFNPHEDSAIEYWIFDENNKLVARNKNFYLKGINLNIGVMSNTYNFPANSFSKSGQLSKKDHSVSTVTYSKSDIGLKEESLHNRNYLANLIKKHYKKDSKNAGYFFTKKEDAFNDLKNFFNEITKIDDYEFFIVDPFISTTSLEYFKLLSNAKVNICFISCWSNSISPDGVKNTPILQTIEEAQLELDKLKDFNLPISYAKWFNLKPDKFHDRYLYLVNKNSLKTKVFIISNSLNNLLVNYENLIVLPLKDSVKSDAENYIKSLILLCDNEKNRVYPRIDK
jgi:hypothetical protein